MKLPPTADFLSEMAGMREWLDLEQESVIIEVEFKEEEEAEIFKQYFDGAKTIQISVLFRGRNYSSGKRAGVGRQGANRRLESSSGARSSMRLTSY